MLNDIITFSSLSLTVIALLLAIWPLRQARSQTSELDSIRQSLSTRFIGQFPSYLPQILEILEKAKREIAIVCDVPAWAVFSDPKNGLKYRQLIESKIHDGVEVNLIFLNEARRTLLYNDQFIYARKNWDEWKKQALVTPKLEAILKYDSAIDKTFENMSYDDFMYSLKNKGLSILKYSFINANNLIELDSNLAIYFWIVDGLNAVFAIPKFSILDSGFVTSGFTTSDPRLISGLISLKNWYYERSKNVPDPKISIDENT